MSSRAVGQDHIGACQLFRRDDSPENGREIGYWLHPAATGCGVATRAARALVDQAFRLPGVDYVEVVHDPANRASGAVPARLGFTEHLRRPAERVAPAATGEEQVWRLSIHQATGHAVARSLSGAAGSSGPGAPVGRRSVPASAEPGTSRRGWAGTAVCGPG
ncbi:GNAT family N-acetyltransferase [Streptomyces sp. NPDC060031]|uniref:GNAT family N-acetyltransferase n=1 Tax=Streptomyces sp. NPDC060031 TaxID=3347043 RepID=UPI0036792F9D